MKLQLKRSNVLDGGVAKAPLATNTDYGELAVNYNADDPTIFLKDSDNNMVKLSLNPTSGQSGYWSRTGTTLSPAISGDGLSADGSITTANNLIAGTTSDGSQVLANGSAIGKVGGITQWYLNNNGNFSAEGSITGAGAIIGKLQNEYAVKVTNGGNNRGGLYNHADGLQLYLVDSADVVQVDLSGASGNITAKGLINSGDVTNGTGVRLYDDGNCYVRNDTGSSYALRVFSGGFNDGNTTFSVLANGALTCDGAVYSRGNITSEGTISGTLSGDGSSITSLNASNLASGTVDSTRLSGNYDIDILGNAATATTASACSGNAATATNATNASNADKLDNLDSTQFLRSDQSGTLSGNLSVTGDVTAFASSDINLKKDIEPIDGALQKVLSLSGVTYNWKDEYKTDREAGVIAQEVQKVLPEVVTTREDGYLAVRYERLVPLLIEAIKELAERG